MSPFLFSPTSSIFLFILECTYNRKSYSKFKIDKPDGYFSFTEFYHCCSLDEYPNLPPVKMNFFLLNLNWMSLRNSHNIWMHSVNSWISRSCSFYIWWFLPVFYMTNYFLLCHNIYISYLIFKLNSQQEFHHCLVFFFSTTVTLLLTL
jgi:hypothetical protein